MKAIVYGPSKTLALIEVEKPVPADDEVLLKVRAASVNPLDAHILNNAPLVRSILFKVIGARVVRPGFDLAGEVEAVGKSVTRFAPGDAVFGACPGGAFAEYACTSETRLAMKPTNINFESAATVNVAGRTALQGIRDIAGVTPGQSVLINGAAGGIGTFAVQISKWLRAKVTGVCSTRNVEMVRRIGADHVIDYTKQDFAKNGEQYDVIFDLVADRPLRSLRHVLTPQGKWIGAGVLGRDISIIRAFAASLKGPALSLIGKQKFISFMTKRQKGDLDVFADLMERGTITPVIDRTFRLTESAEALAYVDAKHARGKVVISIAD
jgi:NADPH:quinone reductase-like Zn-dependent oxidoreductase